MIENAQKILIVCFANYCRSPVAEIILASLFKDKSFSSAGIKPMPQANMDQRSSDFLNTRNYKLKIHNPRRINKELIKDNDLILAMDSLVLFQLNKEFKNLSHKFKIFNHHDTKINLHDPFKMEDENYFKIMENIEYLCKKLL